MRARGSLANVTIETTANFVPFQAVFNFRDVGGLSATGGTVQYRRLFRSDTLARLADADRSAYEELGVRTVIDLRRPEEVLLGRAPQWAAPAYHHCHLDHPYWKHTDYQEELGVARYLADRYVELARHGHRDIARVVELVADEDSGPVAVHCVAGKDRTGTVVAFILDLLGVDDEAIANEYALTEQSEAAFVAWARLNVDGFADRAPVPYYVSTPPEAMLLTLRQVRTEFGSVRELLRLSPETVELLTAKFVA
jgi:protein-tyrosine phosphatase